MAKLKKVSLGLMVLLLVLPGMAFTQEKSEITVDGIWLSPTGVEDFVGYEGKYTETYTASGVPTEVTLDYGDEVSPISLSPESKATPKLEAVFRPGEETGIRLTYWATSGSASQSGEMPGMSLEEGVDAYTFAVDYAYLWNELFYSCYEVGGVYYPYNVATQYSSSDEFEISNIECMFDFPIRNSSNTGFSLLGGLRLGSWKDELNGEVSGTFHYEWAEDDYWHDEYHLTGTSSSDFSGIGPAIGGVGEIKLLDWLSFQGKFTCSLLTGEAKRAANLTDVDEYHDVYPSYEETGTLTGTFPAEDKRTVSVPVNEFQIGLVIQRGGFIAKVGYFSSTWTDIAAAPTFDYPSATWDLTRRKTVKFSGPSITIGMRF
jgi:hypothetical protein